MKNKASVSFSLDIIFLLCSPKHIYIVSSKIFEVNKNNRKFSEKFKMSNLFLKIKELAHNKKLSFAQIERDLNFGNGTISSWQKSKPSIDKLEKIANYFHVSTDYLLDRDSQKDKQTDEDLNEMLDNARSFDGKPMTEHDRELIKSYLKGLYDSK